MTISKHLVNNIIERLNHVINQDINFIDTDAVILSSTNKDRIGDFHGGAQKVLSENKKNIIKYNGEYLGAKEGMNLPVYFNNKIIGVIGITGKTEEIEKYGEIIQSMTEILLKEAYFLEQKNINKETRRRFVEELLFRKNDDNDKSLLIRSELLDININIPRIVIMGGIKRERGEEIVNMPTLDENVYNDIKQSIKFNMQNILIQNGTNYIILLDSTEVNKTDIDELIFSIHQKINDKYGVKLCFGVGGETNRYNELSESYIEARRALNTMPYYQKKCVIYYSELDIGLLWDSIPQNIRSKFIQRVFRGIDSDELKEYVDFLFSYFQNEGSINKIAEKLYVHKNTVQYRVKKIKSLTGYDVRAVDDAVILYLAIVLYKMQD